VPARDIPAAPIRFAGPRPPWATGSLESALGRYLLRAVIGLVLLVAPISHVPRAEAASLAQPAFTGLWTHTDLPVAQETVDRTWLWGPTPLSPGIYERYLDAPGRERLVQYFDKGRMEINDPTGDASSPWYVTSGLLTRELISGRIQIGTSTFINAAGGAAIPVAGDLDNPFPTYRDLNTIIDRSQPDQTGSFATSELLPSGSASHDAAADPNAQFVQYINYDGPMGTTVGYNIPRAFWELMTQPGLVQQGSGLAMADPLFNWLFVLGYPISDPFWVQVRVGGIPSWVLVQPFERRVLTYTPTNPTGWQTEMGNIGQHYYRWRYGSTAPVTVNGDLGHFALSSGNSWTYGTTQGSDATWTVTGTSRSFSGGSVLVTRDETSLLGERITYWGVTPDGLDLYGWDAMSRDGRLTDSVVYSPPVRYLPGGNLSPGQTWSTTTTVLSIRSPGQTATVSVQAVGQELVSTSAGYFVAWRLVMTGPAGAGWPSSDGPNASTTIWWTPQIGIVEWLNDTFSAQLKSDTIAPPGS